jgi:hypothetical protein
MTFLKRDRVAPAGSRRWRWALAPCAAIAAVWASVVMLMLALESTFLYFPARTLDAQPRDYGLAADEVHLTASDGVHLHGWWLRGRGERALIWLHGNAGNISHRLDNAKRLIDRFGLDILLVDYRGYGLSEGKPDEPGLYRDGLAMYGEAVRRGFTRDRIVLFGRSLGAAVAVEVALQKPHAALILETPFLSVPAMARVHYPFVPAVLIRSRFDVESKIASAEGPTLILHGDRDEIVPLAHARRIFELAREPRRFYLIRGAGHNDTYLVGGEEYFKAWQEFLAAI